MDEIPREPIAKMGFRGNAGVIAVTSIHGTENNHAAAPGISTRMGHAACAGSEDGNVLKAQPQSAHDARLWHSKETRVFDGPLRSLRIAKNGHRGSLPFDDKGSEGKE